MLIVDNDLKEFDGCMFDQREFVSRIKSGLIVSCQALEGEPLHGAQIMARMALAAQEGGAVGIRCNGVADVIEIRKAISLPIIGIIKQGYQGYEPYITPTMAEVTALMTAGADIIAVDATHRLHPEGGMGADFIREIKSRYAVTLLADVSTLEEGLEAQEAGADFISTTLSGYTAYSLGQTTPDFELVRALSSCARIPVLAEGRVETPEQALQCLACGAHAVIIGAAITRPQIITQTFVKKMREGRV